MSKTLNTLAAGGSYFEAPRWFDGRWWTSDVYRQHVYSYTPGGERELVHSLDGDTPSGLGFLPDGSLLIVAMATMKVWRRSPDGQVSLHADLSSLTTSGLNDMVVGEDGWSFVGTYGFDPFNGDRPVPATVIGISPEGVAEVVAEDLIFPNGMVIAPDGRLIVGEGLIGQYTSFSIGEGGSLHDRRVWARLSAPPSMESMEELMETAEVIFDGCAVDVEGAIWAADVKNARCIRLREGGQILDEIAAPDGQNIFACMLGGDDGRTLLMCVAPGLRDNNRLDGLQATLRTAHVDVGRAGRP